MKKDLFSSNFSESLKNVKYNKEYGYKNVILKISQTLTYEDVFGEEIIV